MVKGRTEARHASQSSSSPPARNRQDLHLWLRISAGYWRVHKMKALFLQGFWRWFSRLGSVVVISTRYVPSSAFSMIPPFPRYSASTTAGVVTIVITASCFFTVSARLPCKGSFLHQIFYRLASTSYTVISYPFRISRQNHPYLPMIPTNKSCFPYCLPQTWSLLCYPIWIILLSLYQWLLSSPDYHDPHPKSHFKDRAAILINCNNVLDSSMPARCWIAPDAAGRVELAL